MSTKKEKITFTAPTQAKQTVGGHAVKVQKESSLTGN